MYIYEWKEEREKGNSRHDAVGGSDAIRLDIKSKINKGSDLHNI